MREKTLIFLSPHDPADVLNWSGTLNALYKALENYSAGVKLVSVTGGFYGSLAWHLNNLLWFIGFKFDWRYTTLHARCAGLYVSARLMLLPDGPIVAVSASNYTPYLITRRRIIYISDATFRVAAEIYPAWKALPKWLYKQFNDNEAKTLRRASAIIMPSKWASDSVKNDYDVAPDRIYELPFGANIPTELVEKYYSPKSLDETTLNLVFVSADWKRKGGDKAVEICRALIKRGILARLIILGNAPESVGQLGFVDARGFLNKSNRAELEEICRAYRDAHFLVLPTRADASPIVFSECRAFGVPPITHSVGGTSSAIDHGHTGLLLPLDASADCFADDLARYARDAALYKHLSAECRKWYVDRAQWSNWARLIMQLAGLEAAVSPGTGQARMLG